MVVTRSNVTTNVVADISASGSGSLEIVNREDLLFPDAPSWTIRSARKVGVYQENESQRTFVYDTEANRFEQFTSMAESDVASKEYYERTYGWYSYPTVMTDWEAVINAWEKRFLLRTSLQPPTLLMLAARALFKDPKVAKLNAAQFRRMTGVDLTGHFG